jgi:hypothetical protein
MPGRRILLDLRIDKEDHRHLDLLPGLQRLLGEAEALDLAEILPGAAGDTLKLAVPVVGRATRLCAV